MFSNLRVSLWRWALLFFFSVTHRHTRNEQTQPKTQHKGTHMKVLFTVLLREASRAQTGRHKSDRSTLHPSLLCGSRTLAALLRKQQSGFFQGPRVKGLLWLHARLVTGNIEIWLSSGIYPLTLLNVPVCSSVDGMWEFMCTTRWLCLSFKGILF